MGDMKTIMLVGHRPRGAVAEGLFRAGFFVLTAGNAETALAILNAVRADGFVIDVGEAAAGGERLIESVQSAERSSSQPPIVATGANPSQYARLSRSSAVAEVIPACEHGSAAVVSAVRRAMHPPKATRPSDDVPGRSAWDRGGDMDVSMRTLRRWIAADWVRAPTR
jgi:hypothetical protein